ncbi:PH domain-containing protein [Bacillus timonensis]|nr:PH domain-containing protein [Bacillus timonensis]
MRDVPQNRINDRALKVWRIAAAMKSAFGWLLIIVAVVLTALFDWSYWIVITLFVLSVVESFLTIYLIPKIRWKRWRYEVHEQEVDLQHGVVVKKRTLIPMVRVQHVDTYQGPILRKYKLATVKISTAATVHEIPALDVIEADELRDNISKLARVVEEDV